MTIGTVVLPVKPNLHWHQVPDLYDPRFSDAHQMATYPSSPNVLEEIGCQPVLCVWNQSQFSLVEFSERGETMLTWMQSRWGVSAIVAWQQWWLRSLSQQKYAACLKEREPWPSKWDGMVPQVGGRYVAHTLFHQSREWKGGKRLQKKNGENVLKYYCNSNS